MWILPFNTKQRLTCWRRRRLSRSSADPSWCDMVRRERRFLCSWRQRRLRFGWVEVLPLDTPRTAPRTAGATCAEQCLRLNPSPVVSSTTHTDRQLRFACYLCIYNYICYIYVIYIIYIYIYSLYTPSIYRLYSICDTGALKPVVCRFRLLYWIIFCTAFASIYPLQY